MSAKHTHWGVEYLTNSSGRREGWHLCLQSIRPRRFHAVQAALDDFVSQASNHEALWQQWHDLRWAGKIRVVKLSITKTGAQHDH